VYSKIDSQQGQELPNHPASPELKVSYNSSLRPHTPVAESLIQ
jgi:hypothetical protein